MRPVYMLFAWSLATLAPAQESQNDERIIGFADTLLFCDSVHYAEFGYDGPAPLFIQLWYPLGDDPGSAPLRYADLRVRSLDAPLSRVYRELLLRMDSAFIEYDLRYPIEGDGPIDYAPFTAEQVMDSLFALPTRAQRVPMPVSMDAPVVIYHHGSQGLSDENVAMAEYFAANGFAFVSCNFHWPMERAPYGTPLVWAPDVHTERTIARFARQLGQGNKVFYIGHSWGAQEGWCTLFEPGLVDGFASLETTMEWKTDTAEVRDKWPYVLDAITTQRYPMPILMVADTDGEPPFPMFRHVRADLRYLDPKGSFGHESYTSAYMLRLLGEGWLDLPDAPILREQQVVYRALLSELLAYFQELADLPVQAPTYPGGDPFHR
jgi:pimeloyl-ACP methyl ester carboxylesterase